MSVLKKIKSHLPYRAIAGLFVTSLFIVNPFVSLTASAQNVTKGYGSDQVLQRGMIVGLTKANAEKVEPIDISRLKTILGVVVNPNDAPITISSNNQNIFVVSSGRYDVLVSDQNGPIAATDYVTLSSLAGVGMKANDEQSTVIGRAITGFDGKNNVLSDASLQTDSGKKQTVNVGRIQVDIALLKNPLARENAKAPPFLDNIGQAVAGRSVSTTRLYVAMVIFVLGTAVAGLLLYSGIRNGIISLGRNPLGKRSIAKSMLGVAITSIIVFLVSIIGVYLILRL